MKIIHLFEKMKNISFFSLLLLLIALPAAGEENFLRVISPYWYEGTWVFDDDSLDLEREPFIGGVPEMIDELVDEIPNAENGFRLYFSHAEFPEYQARIDWIKADMDGNWYRWKEKELEGWLCPALLKYYPKPPSSIYVRAEPIKRR